MLGVGKMQPYTSAINLANAVALRSNLMKKMWTTILWTCGLIAWPIFIRDCLVLAGNFLTSPLGFKPRPDTATEHLLTYIAIPAAGIWWWSKCALEDLKERERWSWVGKPVESKKP